MNSAAVDRIAKALLYEGYLLYPYRPSAIKNRQRFNFGVLYPRPYSDAQGGNEPWLSRTECLVNGTGESLLEIKIRFLQLAERSIEQVKSDANRERVGTLRVDGQLFQGRQDAIEQEVALPSALIHSLMLEPLDWSAAIVGSRTEEEIRDRRGMVIGYEVRESRAMELRVNVSAEEISGKAFKISVRIENATGFEAVNSSRDEALLHSPVSTHTILIVESGEFISLLEPQDEFASLTAQCQNLGSYPVLAGDPVHRDTMLSSPIILYDYPTIAPESGGDLFDGTEIDEILSLRIMTLTDEEKEELRSGDVRARQILERTENLPEEQLMKLHGVLRGLHPSGSDQR